MSSWLPLRWTRLDYGCGIGQTVTLGRARELDIWGADTFSLFPGWADLVKPDIRDRIHRIENDRTDFPESHFDLVISNQVLEHVTHPEAVIAEIHRVVKPGGLFIAAFPVTETMSAIKKHLASRSRICRSITCGRDWAHARAISPPQPTRYCGSSITSGQEKS